MKTLIAVVFAAAVTLMPLVHAEERAPAPATVVAPKLDPGTVPGGRTYVQLDASGRKLAEFLAGQKTPMAVTDCVQVNCPDTFGKDVVCWKCKERLKSN